MSDGIQDTSHIDYACIGGFISNCDSMPACDNFAERKGFINIRQGDEQGCYGTDPSIGQNRRWCGITLSAYETMELEAEPSRRRYALGNLIIVMEEIVKRQGPNGEKYMQYVLGDGTNTGFSDPFRPPQSVFNRIWDDVGTNNLRDALCILWRRVTGCKEESGHLLVEIITANEPAAQIRNLSNEKLNALFGDSKYGDIIRQMLTENSP